MNFEACLALPHDPREAALIADNLEALARALRVWPAEAWQAVNSSAPESEGLFDRLVARTAPVATDPALRVRSLESAEATAAVLRVLWPEASGRKSPPPPIDDLVTA